MSPLHSRLVAKTLSVALSILALAACTPTSSDALVVLAASSLSTVLPDVSEQTYSFDGSAALVDQLAAGAPADVLVTADTATMTRSVDAGLVDPRPTAFATNVLVLITPAGNPAQITGLDDSLSGKKLVVCAHGVPCGTATKRFADAHGIALRPVSEETKVTDVLGRVTSGEADAGIVYATDARRASDKVVTFALPGAEAQRVTYWAGIVATSHRKDDAAAFIASLTSPATQQRLVGLGFGTPP